jgi:tight adherence protein C
MEPLRLAFDAILSSAHLPVVFLVVACVLLVAGSRALLVESAVRERAADLPPPAWRHVWRLVGVVSIACRPLIAADLRLRTARRLRSAGLEFAVLPDEWVAASLLAGGAGALAGITLALVAGFPALAGALPAVVLGLLLPQAALADRIQGRRRAMARQLPFLLDLITLGVESGLNPSAAITLAVAHAPAGAMRDELARVLRDVRAGRPRAEALRLLAERTEIAGVASFAAAMLSAERQGLALGPLLRAQAQQRRSERFLQAEKRAMEAPVKLLLPLVAFIFPGTFAVLLFPIGMQLLREGLF